ncbi:meiotic nuclear division protein 1 homolog isoform X1 [Diaphorina citri]|uniref:Meiotic nuclear division protein 1 homolog n=1 Tax=Diaphorina citri TaxID=121845 RepID=A0A1S3DF72_DIACI|nr:meiotic nuclear division protein 1 homolog isoform X1 [Diaphorina citri]XP_008479786.1 meiotic nuclear division protein 1 homolog isoform X1 [Diaphorina citri]XP_017302753.1 meiotic nuclear division protein 1 homolog isoform X1 [Diaphorina citri]XP_026684718.1 meiotic nuclear division protein 1 homolog isoform X1 [Diaphorina citri]XP_026684721.1 meiotic nuclear division protein 1 homolog isoform X1 [Diaphorina citri]KAI5712028.1 hypothetical protein M8J75_005184 [Diaphorina citri]KAI574859
MSKKKGLSVEEKRTGLLELFHEKEEFFQLKELEKLAPKEKGIISQSVKEILQSLVDDGLVESEKIGTSTYFWSFPNKASDRVDCKLEKITAEIEDVTKELAQNNEALEKSMVGRGDSKNREDFLQEVGNISKELELINKELEKYKNNDPDTLKLIENTAQRAKEAANRWTDNLFSLKSWCKNKFGLEETALNKHFSIPEEMDYID